MNDNPEPETISVFWTAIILGTLLFAGLCILALVMTLGTVFNG